jgi:hypothetical protein
LLLIPSMRNRAAGIKKKLVAGAPLLVVFAALAAHQGRASADAQDPKEANERCASRVSISILGKSASPDLMMSAAPQAGVDAMLQDPAFVERFARFINASFNRRPADTAEGDAPYYMTKFVLANKKPWKEMFVGPYKVDIDPANATAGPQVLDDPNGLGYFRSKPWLVRFAGNEASGLKIVTAYRILQNVTGLQLIASTNAPDADISAVGRKAQPCASCHFENWYALDNAARVLSKRNGLGAAMTFSPPTEIPQNVADKSVSNDKELVEALVASEDFSFNACRIGFNYLYARSEVSCEGPIFDKCVQDFKATGSITSAIAAIAKDPSFCQ